MLLLIGIGGGAAGILVGAGIVFAYCRAYGRDKTWRAAAYYLWTGTQLTHKG